MGTWGTAIKSNDTSADIYADFFDLYNDGKEPSEIKNKLISDNPNGTNDFWFTLALALWETKSLPTDILEKVRETIKSESDLKVWKELDASESDIKKRKVVLDKFLTKLESEKVKPKARKKKSNKEPIFEIGTCLTFKLGNGNYGGAIVLSSDLNTGFGYNLIVSTRINQETKPTLIDFAKSEVLITNFAEWDNKAKITWYLPDKYKTDFSHLFENLGKLEIEKKYYPNSSKINSSFSAGWQHIIMPVDKQFEHEKINGILKSFPVMSLMKEKKKKWWQF